MAKRQSKSNELTTFFGKCRCCTKYGYLKSLWTRHLWDGDVEIYGNMLIQCFGISLSLPGLKALGNEQICDACIERLRDACLFKNQVLDAHKQLLEEAEDGNDSNADEIFNMMFEEHEQNRNNSNESQKDEKDDNSNKSNDDTDKSEDSEEESSKEKEDESYEDVEYLEDEELGGSGGTATGEASDVSSAPPTRRLRQPVKRKPNKKWPTKLAKEHRNITYKQYTSAALQEAIEAIIEKRMSIPKAATKYNVPEKTLKVKVEEHRMDPEKSKMDKQTIFVEEIRTLLRYTNATPFKNRTVRFICAYCPVDGTYYPPEDLRKHIRTEHKDEKLTKIPEILRPAWLNEILKVDIDKLVCYMCPYNIQSWNDMFKHMKRVHDKEFDLAYTRVVPYILNAENKCVLCEEKFPNYNMLDRHMNAHYNNYVCDDCGDNFLTNTRLKQHSATHVAGRFPCKTCGKNFTLAKYRQRHEKSHKNKTNFKCKHCPEKFRSEHKRHVHVMEKHKDKIEEYKCEHCGKRFNFRMYYLKHLKNHAQKKYKCKNCDKKYYYRSDMKRHENKCSKDDDNDETE